MEIIDLTNWHTIITELDYIDCDIDAVIDDCDNDIHKVRNWILDWYLNYNYTILLIGENMYATI